MKIVHLRLAQDHHSCDDAADVAQAINLKGVSTLIAMAASPGHRETVVAYRDAAVWQMLHCAERGDDHERELWFRVAEHVTKVLAGTQRVFKQRLAIAQASGVPQREPAR